MSEPASSLTITTPDASRQGRVCGPTGQLMLYGIRAVYDEIIATAVKRQREPQQIKGDLLHAEVNETRARSIKFQMTIATLALAKAVNEFDS